MKIWSFGDKSAFLGQYVFYFNVLDDYKKNSRNNPQK